MTSIRQNQLRDVSFFCLLVAIGACGRWAQPVWCFTPIAAISVFAGYYFDRWRIAALIPLAALAISDLCLPAYDNLSVLLITYGAMLIPVGLGRLLRGETTLTSKISRWIACGLCPASVFFFTTNFAVWAFQSDYPKTLAGLGECYLAAVPFYRWMLAGDMFYLVVIFGCYAVAASPVRRRQRKTEKIRI